jgi:hypothetical protein
VGKKGIEMKEIAFPQFVLQAPEHWFDVTAELEGDEPPATVAADEGLGALQFSVAELPETGAPASVESLRALLKEFVKGHDLSQPQNVKVQSEPRPLLSANFHWDGDYLHVWYLAEHGRLVFVTYTCDAGEAFAEELGEADAIVKSLQLAAG